MHARPQRVAGRIALFLGLATATVAGVVDASGDVRTISLYHIHTKETLTILYKKDGRYLPEALKKINWIMRDWRRNEAIEMDPKSIDIIWEMHTELGSAQPIHIICGYRSTETNTLLRRTRGGQASQSQHITGKAIDVSFPDVPIRRLRYSAMIRERGGVGYYPTSALPFVHVDTGRVRSWPRMPHDELALLFPSGRSKHASAEGRSLEPGDAAAARRRQPQLAQQMAEYFDLRTSPRKTVLVASAGNAVLPQPPAPRPAIRPERRPEPAKPTVLAALGPPPLPRPAAPRPPELRSPEPRLASLTRDDAQPRLVRKPRLVERSSRFTPGPSVADRRKLDELVTLAALGPGDGLAAPPRPPVPASRASATGIAAAVLAAARPSVVPPADGGDSGPDLPDRAVAALAAETGLGLPPANFVAAPAFDDDHPEELSYQPFPILPLLTETASADDPALARMVHPNVARTLDMIDDEGRILPMRFRPGEQTAQLLLAKQFTGQAVDLSAVEAYIAKEEPAPAALAERMVRTSPR